MKVLFIYSFFKTKQKYALFAMFASGCRWKFIHTITIHHGCGYLKKYAKPTVPLPPKNYFAFVNLCHRCPHQKIIIINTLQQSLFYVTFIEFIRWCHQIFCNYEFTKLSRYWVWLLTLICTLDVNNNINFGWKIRGLQNSWNYLRNMLLTCQT